MSSVELLAQQDQQGKTAPPASDPGPLQLTQPFFASWAPHAIHLTDGKKRANTNGSPQPFRLYPKQYMQRYLQEERYAGINNRTLDVRLAAEAVHTCLLAPVLLCLPCLTEGSTTPHTRAASNTKLSANQTHS